MKYRVLIELEFPDTGVYSDPSPERLGELLVVAANRKLDHVITSPARVVKVTKARRKRRLLSPEPEPWNATSNPINPD
jgi:hypothetical protein